LRLRQEAADRVGEAITSYNLAKLYDRKGYLREAEALLTRTVEIEERINHPDLPKDQAELSDLRARRRAVFGSTGDTAPLPRPPDLQDTRPHPRPPQDETGGT